MKIPNNEVPSSRIPGLTLGTSMCRYLTVVVAWHHPSASAAWPFHPVAVVSSRDDSITVRLLMQRRISHRVSKATGTLRE